MNHTALDIELEINKEFEEQISKLKQKTVPEEKRLIPFRDWQQNNKFQQVYRIPIKSCRYRLENGRIASKVKTYEAKYGNLEQKDPKEREEIIHNFLSEHNPKKNKELTNLIKNAGQKEPAVITSDGFLINGNRRKFVMQELINEEGELDKYSYMKVVILPGTNDSEKPTLKDIQKIEYHYQVATEGIAEYTNLDKALTYQRSLDEGLRIIDLLRNDDAYKNLEKDELEKEIKRIESTFINPLKLVNDFLIYESTPGDFESISDRWDSFVEAHKVIFSHLNDEKKRDNFCVKNNIQKSELGELHTTVFNLMKIDSPNSQHSKMIREVLKWWKLDKKTTKEIGKIDNFLEDNQKTGDYEEERRIWKNSNGKEIINKVKELSNRTKKKEDREDPIDRLKECVTKLGHKDLEIQELSRLNSKDTETAILLTRAIEEKRKELFNFLTEHEKQLNRKLRELQKKN